MDGLTIHERAAALDSGEHFVQTRAVHAAHHQLARLFIGDGDGVQRQVADEVGGAVDGIDDPPSSLTGTFAVFLTQETILREGGEQHFADKDFAAAVTVGHIVVALLVRNRKRRLAQQIFTGLARRRNGGVKALLVIVHGITLPS